MGGEIRSFAVYLSEETGEGKRRLRMKGERRSEKKKKKVGTGEKRKGRNQ